jgi:hypothetical protein
VRGGYLSNGIIDIYKVMENQKGSYNEYRKIYDKEYRAKRKEYKKLYHKDWRNLLGSGIYVACLSERILYVGQSIELKRRISTHKTNHKNKTSVTNPQLQEYIKQYGDRIEFVILENCAADKLLQREQHYINLLKPEFNIS